MIDTIIIGIDPGSNCTGFGIIKSKGLDNHYVDSGYIKTTYKTLSGKLKQIYDGIVAKMEIYKPTHGAIEQVFVHLNANAALKLGQARGAAIVGMSAHHIPVAEYSARQIKQSVVGYGAAQKEQVQHMVKQLLNIKEPLQADEADALAVAICHATVLNTQRKLEKATAGQ